MFEALFKVPTKKYNYFLILFSKKNSPKGTFGGAGTFSKGSARRRLIITPFRKNSTREGCLKGFWAEEKGLWHGLEVVIYRFPETEASPAMKALGGASTAFGGVNTATFKAGS